MVGFEIICHQREVRPIYTLGSSSPTTFSYGVRNPTEIKFECGLKFLVMDDQWVYNPDPVAYDMYTYHGLRMHKERFDAYSLYDINKAYTIDEILEISPEYIQDVIIFNMDIFRKVE